MKLKDKKIEILAVTITRDNEGFSTETLTPIAPPVWAYFRQLSGKEVFAAATVQATEEVLFQITYRADVTTAQVIRYNDNLYDITRVDVFEGYKSDLIMYAKKRA